jgi:hypothetical protein
MPIRILSHPDRQRVHKLPFCYLCGKPIESKAGRSADHVPPKTMFHVEDRQPLMLTTHKWCNESYSDEDEKAGHLIGLKTGTAPKELRNLRLKFERLDDKHHAVVNFRFKDAVWRWVRGFHAALYRQHLQVLPNSGNPPGDIQTIFSTIETNEEFSAKASVADVIPIKEQFPYIVEVIKFNRAHKNLDTIVSNNGKMRYECVWMRPPTEPWWCFFALDIYDWKDLGASGIQPPKGCVGNYCLFDGTTPKGATESVLEGIVQAYNNDKLDAFAP